MTRTYILIAAILAAACGAPVEASPPEGPPFAYSHTIPAPGCSLESTAPELVLLRCGPGEPLTAACEDGASVDVWVRPGANEGQPFGVASYVVVECP